MMKKIPGLILISGFLLLLAGCPNGGHKYEQGQFPVNPVNFEAVNSEFDDYNSTAPFIESERYLYFSSNRNSSGADFDIVGKNFRIYWDMDEGTLDMDITYSSWKDYRYTDSLFMKMNTGFNEFGPYSVSYYTYTATSNTYQDIIIFATDESGDLDLKFVAFTGNGENPGPIDGTYEGPDQVSFLNTASNDAYLTFFGPGYIWSGYNYEPSGITEVLFCSDRGGDYDIYQSDVPMQDSSDILNYLRGDQGEPITPVDILNSTSQDKCPYADGNLLVFASDRPGGYGGYDLYYSTRNGDTWSAPVNYGERINTEYDEFRPIVMGNYEFVNDLMIFSSDRPGGKGGFDLYYVGVPKMIYYGLD
jgi:hypothetical protein